MSFALGAWKKKAEKLRLLILSSEIDQTLQPEMATLLDAQRAFRKTGRAGQGEFEAVNRAFTALQASKPQRLIWEPFSDMRGESMPPRRHCALLHVVRPNRTALPRCP